MIDQFCFKSAQAAFKNDHPHVRRYFGISDDLIERWHIPSTARWEIFFLTGKYFLHGHFLLVEKIMNNQSFSYSSADEVINAAKSIMESIMVDRDVSLTSPVLVKEYLMMRLARKEHEVFCVLFLDNQNRLIAAEDMFRGTIDGASVYPREVVKAAIKHNAAALIIAHNHPSGVAEPSKADRAITLKLQSAMDLIDVRIVDHIVVAGTDQVSFAERGLL
jgi:DNA repair protein RadC